MPTSPYTQIPVYASFLLDINPASILDIGIGNGKLGFVARDLLDVMYGGQYKRSNWRIQLDGIEAFGEYIQDHQKAIYNDIYIGDAFDVIDTLGTYDMIVMGDVLEHFPKNEGCQMIHKCFSHLTKAMALFVPLGEGWDQPAIYGNEFERHRSTWYHEEFESMSKDFKIAEFKNIGYYGAYLISKEGYIDEQIAALKAQSFA